MEKFLCCHVKCTSKFCGFPYDECSDIKKKLTMYKLNGFCHHRFSSDSRSSQHFYVHSSQVLCTIDHKAKVNESFLRFQVPLNEFGRH